MTWKPRRLRVPFQWQYQEKRKQQETMDVKTYQECALRTMANQNVIRQRLYDMGSPITQLENGIRGLTNEVGELAEITKKCIEYGKGPVDVVHLKEEVGDCFWRLRQICDAVGLTFEECMQANIEKLKIRYPKEFSDIQAQEENRDRAGEREAMILPSINLDDPIPVTTWHNLPKIGDPFPDGLEEYVDEYQQTGSGFAEPPEEKPVVYGDNRGNIFAEPLYQNPQTTALPRPPLTSNEMSETLENDSLPSEVRVTIKDGEAKIDSSVPTVVRKPLNHSYTRYCAACLIQPIHKTNTIGVCASCYARLGEPVTCVSTTKVDLEVHNDTRTTG